MAVVILFPDKNLEKKIRETLGQPEGPILEDVCAKIKSLNAPACTIKQLEGLQYCVNLNMLALYNNISDIRHLNKFLIYKSYGYDRTGLKISGL